MAPPASFKYALFSNTSVTTKNNDIVTGDIWANQNVVVTAGTTVHGSVTGATGYVSEENGSIIDRDATSGGFNPATSYAIDVQTNASVGGNVKATVVNPPDPIKCGGANQGNYNIHVDSGAVVTGSGKTWGTFTGPGNVQGGTTSNVCISAPATNALPVFTWSPSNYDATTLHQFGTAGSASSTAVADFTSYVNAQPGKQIQGTFYINQSAPVSQDNRIDLTGVTIIGDTTIVSNTPIFANGLSDNNLQKIFVLVSTYDPPTGTSCDVNNDASECSIDLKNNFQPSCATAVLAYAPYGPTAVKNNATTCGAVYSDDIEVKNNQTLTYDSRVERLSGFGPVTFEVTRWVELKP
ncbi:MAG: hypothetical protein LC663_00995, partial [Actinobacteria bacterium]|nr:hypothetical protein [Actinomycetota bacterium]